MSLLDFSSLEKNQIQQIFKIASTLVGRKEPKSFSHQAALVFFEPSTRTRLSFELACVREGVYPMMMDAKSGSSLEKGESLEDTLLNIQAMDPDFFIVRCGDQLDLRAMSNQLGKPILNAGWGRKAHPTQALLDSWTIQQKTGSLAGRKLLIVGDVKHSRVAASHFQLAQILGYQIGVCAPVEMMISSEVQAQFTITRFEYLDEALKWADVVMALRVQIERHDSKMILEDYISEFGITNHRLEKAQKDLWIMHPGPINHGVEIESSVLQLPRCLVLDQVRSGVYMRQALIQSLLGRIA